MHRIFLIILLLSVGSHAESREQSPGLDTTYHQVTTPKGYAVEAVITAPAGSDGKLPALFFVGWLSCDPMIYPDGKETDGFSKFILRVARQSKFATFRINKPGIGGSGGPACSRLDFAEELQAYKSAFRYFLDLPLVDKNRVVVVGLSNGGGIAPLVVDGHPVAGYISVGGWGRTWLEHMLEHERERLRLTGKSPQEVNAAMKLFPEFYVRYLVAKQTPGEIAQKDSRFAGLWYDKPDSQYGRPAAFYQQLQELNLGQAWSAVDVPTLVVRGSFDWIMSEKDALAIVDAVNAKGASPATFVSRPGMDHFLMLHDTYLQSMADSTKFDDGLVAETFAWLAKNLPPKQK